MNEIEYVITFDSKEKRMKNPLESWIINLKYHNELVWHLKSSQNLK